MRWRWKNREARHGFLVHKSTDLTGGLSAHCFTDVNSAQSEQLRTTNHAYLCINVLLSCFHDGLIWGCFWCLHVHVISAQRKPVTHSSRKIKARLTSFINAMCQSVWTVQTMILKLVCDAESVWETVAGTFSENVGFNMKSQSFPV